MYEVNIILNNTDKSLVQLIPEKVLNFIKENAQKQKEFIYDKNKRLKDQEISNITRGVIALIYRDYFCTEEQRKRYNDYYKKLKEQLELEKRDLYNVEKMFKKNSQTKSEEITDLKPYKKETIWTKLKNIFLNLFR
mgnify:FL=1